MYPSYEFAYMLEEIGLTLIPAILSGIPSGLFGIAAYVLTALALYTLAKRRAIDHPWMAWVPVLNCWLLGSLSDQYRYVVKGQIKSKRKVMLVLKLVSAILSVTVISLAIAMVVKAVRLSAFPMRGDMLLEELMGLAIGTVVAALPLMGVAIAAAVLRYMALYDIYTSCDPDNNVLFIVLSILFSVTEPFFLFFSRNKDLGMPPRREAPAWQPEQPTQNPWENEMYE